TTSCSAPSRTVVRILGHVNRTLARGMTGAFANQEASFLYNTRRPCFSAVHVYLSSATSGGRHDFPHRSGRETCVGRDPRVPNLLKSISWIPAASSVSGLLTLNNLAKPVRDCICVEG